jgi:hypothetical protein
VKRATASRLGKAGIAIPVAVALLALAVKTLGGLIARSADFMPHGRCFPLTAFLRKSCAA